MAETAGGVAATCVAAGLEATEPGATEPEATGLEVEVAAQPHNNVKTPNTPTETRKFIKSPSFVRPLD